MSEGEKKLILVKTVLEILSDEKTLVLMDEPDAHLHEGRKPALCNMMREYPNRQKSKNRCEYANFQIAHYFFCFIFR